MTLKDELNIVDPRMFGDDTPAVRALFYVISKDGKSLVPMTEGAPSSSSGSSNGSSSGDEKDNGQVFPPALMTVGNQAVFIETTAQLPLESRATVHVISGAIRRSIGGTPSATTPILRTDDNEELFGNEISEYQMIRDGASDATVYIEFTRKPRGV